MNSDIINDLIIINYPKITIDKQIDQEFIKEAIVNQISQTNQKFKSNQNYYLGKNKNLRHNISNDAPDNQINIPYARKIVTTIKGYMFKPGNIKYIPESSDIIPEQLIDEYYTKIQDIFKYNNEQLVTSELGEDQSKYGIAFEMLYIDQLDNNKIKFRKIDPSTIIPIFSDDLNELLLYAIRFIKKIEKNKESYDIELYTKNRIYYYIMENDTLYKKENESINIFNDIPLVIYKNNEEYLADYEPIQAMIQLYDKLYSDSANELDRFAAAYLVFKNFVLGGNEEEVKNNLDKLKKLRVFEIDGDGDVKFLTKEIPTAFFKEIKDSIQREIIKQSQIPDFTDETFNTASGIAIKYKLIDLENLCSFKEAYFKTGLFRRLKLINTYLKVKEDINIDDYIEIIFTRNITDNLNEISDVVTKLNGIISKETLLSLLPFIKDINQELSKIEKNKEDENKQFDIERLKIENDRQQNNNEDEEDENKEDEKYINNNDEEVESDK